MVDTYNELIERNTLDAFDYYERITDYIDEVYKTEYDNLEMNDEIENIVHKIKNDKDYETAERMYNLACQKYQLIKDNKYIDPRLKHVNSCYVFDSLFSDMLLRSEGFPDVTIEEIKEQLIDEFPECKDFITLELSDDLPDEHDDIWLMPQDVLLSESYRSLYIKLLEMFKQ